MEHINNKYDTRWNAIDFSPLETIWNHRDEKVIIFRFIFVLVVLFLRAHLSQFVVVVDVGGYGKGGRGEGEGSLPISSNIFNEVEYSRRRTIMYPTVFFASLVRQLQLWCSTGGRVALHVVQMTAHRPYSGGGGGGERRNYF